MELMEDSRDQEKTERHGRRISRPGLWSETVASLTTELSNPGLKASGAERLGDGAEAWLTGGKGAKPGTTAFGGMGDGPECSCHDLRTERRKEVEI